MAVKILLVEDNEDHIQITTRMLQNADKSCQVDCAMSCAAGLDKIRQGDYDVVVCDYRLPDGTALDALKKIKSEGKTIPFIVATALGSEKAAVELMKEGAWDYIVKDFMYGDTLNSVIRKTVDVFKTKKEKERLEAEIVQAYTKLKETQDQLMQAEKLKAVGELASGIAHEVRNPFGIILQGVDYLENKITEKTAEVSQTLAMIKESVQRADTIINTLLDFSKPNALELHAEEILSVIDSALMLVKIPLEIKKIPVTLGLNSDLPKVMVDKTKLEQVFINILLNSIQAMPDGGQITIRGYVKELEEVRIGIDASLENNFSIGEKALVIEIEDTGTGIDEKNIKKVFDPFFTTKGPKKGTGLGLSVSHNIIGMHKGLIDIKSSPGRGTTVSLTLKIAGGDV